MYKIKGKKSGMVWDGENNRPLIKFVDGEAQTGDTGTAQKLSDMGYEVEGLEPPKPAAPKPIDKMTEAELRAYAAEKGIGLDGLTKKADVLAAIVAAEQKQTGGGE